MTDDPQVLEPGEDEVIVIDTGIAGDMELADYNADWILTPEQRRIEMQIIEDSKKLNEDEPDADRS